MFDQPLVQFLFAGAVVFGLYEFLGDPRRDTGQEVIEVSAGHIEQLNEIFARTWQRPPTGQELRGLVEGYVKEEVYYREGRKAGLDRDDTVIRRRMQQKMEFVVEPDATDLTPDESDLRAFFEANASRFNVPARAAFRQVFFNTGERGQGARDEADALMVQLKRDEGAPDPDELGDPTLLPPRLPLTSIERIAGQFGEDFAAAIAGAPVGQWTGPVRSPFGLHLVRVETRSPPASPALDEVRDRVLAAWRDEKRRQIAEDRYRLLRDKYEVRIVWPEGDAGADREAAARQ